MNWKPIIISIAILFMIWEIAALLLNSPILPQPWRVLYTFFSDLPFDLGRHILVSSWRISLSIVIATALGLPIGLILGQNKKLDSLLYPLIYITYPVPKVALLPIVILFLGIGDTSKVFLISLILFFQVVVIVRDASSNIPAELIHSLRSLGADNFQLLRFVYFPACLPATLTSLRMNVAIAFAILYLAESFATSAGLGFYIMNTWQQLAYNRMYAAILAMSAMGALAFIALAALENRLCRWKKITSPVTTL